MIRGGVRIRRRAACWISTRSLIHPLVLKRFVESAEGEPFYQKRAPVGRGAPQSQRWRHASWRLLLSGSPSQRLPHASPLTFRDKSASRSGNKSERKSLNSQQEWSLTMTRFATLSAYRPEGGAMRLALTGLAFTASLVVATLGTEASAVERSGWSRFHDPEHHMSFEYPAHIFHQEVTQEGERDAVFSRRDGRARLRLFGFVNSRNQTPRSHLAGIPEYRSERFHYVRTTSRFYVASGVRDGMILYRRCNFAPRADRRVGCVQLEYPQAEKRAWDEVVTRISLSLRNNRPPPPPAWARSPRPLDRDHDDEVATLPRAAIPAQPRTAAVTPLPRPRPVLTAPVPVVPKPDASEQPMANPDVPAAEAPKAAEPPPVTAAAPAPRVMLPGGPVERPESTGESRGVVLPAEPPAPGAEPPAEPALPPVQPLD
jgi:hypothetical protein